MNASVPNDYPNAKAANTLANLINISLLDLNANTFALDDNDKSDHNINTNAGASLSKDDVNPTKVFDSNVDAAVPIDMDAHHPHTQDVHANNTNPAADNCNDNVLPSYCMTVSPSLSTKMWLTSPLTTSSIQVLPRPLSSP